MLTDLDTHVKDKLGDAVLSSTITRGELTLVTTPAKIVDVLTFLRDDARCRFDVLIDICGVDWPARERRFDVVYHLLSPRLNQRIRVKLETDEDHARPERDSGLSRPPTGTSARPTTCTASCSRATPICAAC